MTTSDNNGAQYDSIASQYSEGKQSPLRRYVEAYSLFEMIGDAAGKQVVDLACGDGIYARRLQREGAAEVTGVDISQGMIDIAEKIEAEVPKGIRYICADAQQLGEVMPAASADLIVGSYLFHYAPNEKALRNMLTAVRSVLADGGRFVGINENPEQSLTDFAGYAQYGFNKMACAPLIDSSAVTYSMVSGRSMINFEVYYYARSTYERLFAECGFSSWRWLPLQLDPAGVEACGEEYWQEYLGNPPVTGLELLV